ncbi:hypothetical protein [Streptomyces sp. NPDC002758]
MSAPVDARDILAEVADAAVLEPVRHDGYLPADFWTARPVFGRIRDFAHARAASADALFYATLARLSGMISHEFQAESGVGDRASLNLYVGIVAGPGGGKSTAAKAARKFLEAPDPEFRDGLPIGSGEGMAEAFMGTVEEETGETRKGRGNTETPVTKRVRKQVRHNAYFYIDEGQILHQLEARTGSTLGETLRRAAVGETLGQTNAREETTRYIPGGSYALGLVAGFQYSNAMPVIQDASTGTPQRFLWCWAADPTIPFEAPADPGPLAGLKCLVPPFGPVDVTFPKAVRDALRTERVLRNRGDLELPELDAHHGLIKVKVAALLALLDDRFEVADEDWALAETVWAASCGVRDTLLIRAQREAAAAKEEREEAALRAELRAHQAKTDDSATLDRLAIRGREFARKGSGRTIGEFRKALMSRDREHAHRAVDLAEARGWLVVEDGRLHIRTE